MVTGQSGLSGRSVHVPVVRATEPESEPAVTLQPSMEAGHVRERQWRSSCAVSDHVQKTLETTLLATSEPSSMAKELRIKKGSRLGNCHVVEDILGEGSFGIVAKCRNTETNKIEAVRVYKSEEGVLEVAMDEIAILKRLRRLNPDTCNIVQCNGFFFDKENICISFELLDLSLQDYLQEKNPRGLTTRELRPILHQLATALSHLHSSGIIHADLKPPNVMVVNRHEQPLKVKLIDFGVARLVSAVNQGDWMGTLHYSAPEMLLGEPFNESVDMWALGLLMVELATGCQLYPGKTEYDVLRFIFETQGQPCDDVLDRGCYTPDSLNDIKKNMVQDPGYEEDQKIFVSLVKSMLSLDASRRITAQEVLKHRFFKDTKKKKYKK
uniref:Protein kinase domain-containing protein n=1 Tax=Amphiprion percula TaxID=161767 RepID=A0A3P8TBY6_AMPPE